MVADIKVLAVGAHPDDVEIGCGATLALLAHQGYGVGIVDLTRGEMGTNGTVVMRQQEAQAAAGLLGAQLRVNLGLPDSEVAVTPAAVQMLVEVIRQYRPQYILAPYWQDRHPDHAQASLLVQQANFRAGLTKLVTNRPAHRAQRLAYYFINDRVEPTITLDVTTTYEQKRKALATFGSQFFSSQGSQETRLNQGFLAMVESRDRYQGSLIGSEYGEGFIIKEAIKVQDIVKFWEEQI